MHIIYLSCVVSKESFNHLYANNNVIPGQQVQKYHRLILEGIEKNGIEVETITAIPISRRISKKVLIRLKSDISNNVKFNYLTVINIPVIKNISVFIGSLIKTYTALKSDTNVSVVCDVLNISVSFGGLLASKLLKRKSVAIVTDLPEYLYDNKKNIVAAIGNIILKYFDGYIFLTEEMNKRVNTENKPYIVIEGQVDIMMANRENILKNKYKDKVCIYAGGLKNKYGIKYLTEGFIAADIPNTTLHIYGSGEFEQELKYIAKKHHKIKYYGVVSNDKVVDEQMKASLLINPRPSADIYTKYSFPSKNMEYMVSGTPTLTTNLPGMPTEYLDYVYILEDETNEGIRDKLFEILNKDPQELHIKGNNAKAFVLKNKNNVVQSYKILSFINNINNKGSV